MCPSLPLPAPVTQITCQRAAWPLTHSKAIHGRPLASSHPPSPAGLGETGEKGLWGSCGCLGGWEAFKAQRTRAPAVLGLGAAAFGTLGTSCLALCARNCLPGVGTSRAALQPASSDSTIVPQVVTLGWLEISSCWLKRGVWPFEAEHLQLPSELCGSSPAQSPFPACSTHCLDGREEPAARGECCEMLWAP